MRTGTATDGCGRILGPGRRGGGDAGFFWRSSALFSAPYLFATQSTRVCTAILFRVLVLEFFGFHASSDDRKAHGKRAGPEHDEEQVPHHDGQECKPRFVEMNRLGDAYHPARPGETIREPQDEAGDHHDDRAPDQRPVLGLLDVAEALECGPRRRPAEMIGYVLERLSRVA